MWIQNEGYYITSAICDYCSYKEVIEVPTEYYLEWFIRTMNKLEKEGWFWSWMKPPDAVIHWCPSCRKKLPKTLSDAVGYDANLH